MLRYDHFQTDYPNRRTLAITEIKEIDQINLQTSEEHKELEDKATFLPPYMGEMFILRRILHTMEGPQEENQKEYLFHS